MGAVFKISPLPLAALYVVLCIVVLSLIPEMLVGPGSFFVLFLISLILGFFLIVLQVDNDTGDNGEAITLLSGEVIPAVQESNEQKQQDQTINSWVQWGKIVFLPLSVFILVFWVKLTYHGIPKEWWDKGYSLLIYMYAFGEAGKHRTYAYNDFGYGDYLSMTRNLANTGFDFLYISRPSLLSLPYTGFIFWVLTGRKGSDDDN